MLENIYVGRQLKIYKNFSVLSNGSQALDIDFNVITTQSIFMGNFTFYKIVFFNFLRISLSFQVNWT